MQKTVLLLLLLVAGQQATARLLDSTTTESASPLAQLAAMLTQLPEQQLALGVPAADFLAVLAHGIHATDMMVQAKIDMRQGLYALALDTARKVLGNGPANSLLQAGNKTVLLKLPAAIPNLTAAFPQFEITDFPTIPWLNKSITIKGFKIYPMLNSTLSLLVPQLPILKSVLIFNNSLTQATLQVLNATVKAA